jgi:hypothetical protein
MMTFAIVITALFVAMTGISVDKDRGLRSGTPSTGGPGGLGGITDDVRGPYGGIKDESALLDLYYPMPMNLTAPCTTVNLVPSSVVPNH